MSIGIIGGSGLYQWDALTDAQWVDVPTPWGAPSDQFLSGRLAGRQVYFLPRHGRGHRLLPNEINFRANLYAFKMLGVDAVISVSAVGSLREEIRPRDVLVPDQFFDRTRSTPSHTFFGNGIAGHVAFGDPVCPFLRNAIGAVADRVRHERAELADRTVHRSGTYVNMEGPQFSTRAESEFYRGHGFHVIGMTALPEARLAREAELPYATLALITDYDCWHQDEESVSAEMVAGHVRANTAFAHAILEHLVADLPKGFPSPARTALQGAVMTHREQLPTDALTRIPWLKTPAQGG